MGVYIGMDIGGTKFAVAAADKAGKVLRRTRADTPPGLGEGLELLKKMAREAAAGEKVLAIGASIGGPLDWKKGVVSPLHQPEWRNVPLKELMEKEFECPFYVDVDTNVAALGEWKARNGKDGKLLYLTISTGMGGGFIVDGRIYRGANEEHPEVAHQCIRWKGKAERVVCECGAEGCLEELVSGNGIRRLYGKPAEKLTEKEWEEVSHNLGQGLRNMAAIYAPEVIAIGGGVATGAGEKLLGPARKVMEASLKIVPIPKVEPSKLGYDTALIGSITLAMEGKKLGY
jgi:predicted NBD/HSP70 family sugar kinase